MRAQAFAPLKEFLPAAEGYRLLPFRWLRWQHDEVLLVNEVGEFEFLSRGVFDRLMTGELSRYDEAWPNLKAKHFLHDSDFDTPIELLATQWRTKKAHLVGFTELHMFVATLRCDHTCRYCQVSRVTENRSRFDMSEETARAAIEQMFRSPSPRLKVEFQGGEPLLAFDRVRFLVNEIERRNLVEDRDIEFVVTTNLAPLTDSMLDFFAEHEVLISTSLDGPAALHNANRPKPERNSHELFERHLEKARAALGHDRVSAIMTTTERSLEQPRKIVREYVRLGFDSIFLRPLSPYGFAVRTGEEARYESEQFLHFYRHGLDEVIAVNREGGDLIEVFAQLLLTKMLTPFATGYVDLQSPAGTGIGAVAYNYDGLVYPADEARMLAAMGDDTFCLGSVHEHTYEEMFGGGKLRALVAGTVLESVPGCAWCAFQPYCGADPMFHHRTQGDFFGHRPTSAFCARHMATLRHLFELLRSGDDFTRDLLTGWATGGERLASQSGEDL